MSSCGPASTATTPRAATGPWEPLSSAPPSTLTPAVPPPPRRHVDRDALGDDHHDHVDVDDDDDGRSQTSSPEQGRASTSGTSSTSPSTTTTSGAKCCPPASPSPMAYSATASPPTSLTTGTPLRLHPLLSGHSHVVCVCRVVCVMCVPGQLGPADGGREREDAAAGGERLPRGGGHQQPPAPVHDQLRCRHSQPHLQHPRIRPPVARRPHVHFHRHPPGPPQQVPCAVCACACAVCSRDGTAAAFSRWTRRSRRV
jgi:hypothetical protein